MSDSRGSGDRPSVLFVTSELIGPFKNGGIGTATTGLIETVAGMGCPTTVLYTGAIWHVEIDMAPWIRRYAEIGVELVALTLADMRHLAGTMRDEGLGSAYLVYRFLEGRHFDIVHFNDTLGEGMYALAAKRLGLGFADSWMALGLHSPTRWIMRLNKQRIEGLIYAAFDAMERVSIRSADLLWGPSAYLIEEIGNDGWALPAETLRQQYVMPTADLFSPDPAKFARADAPPPQRVIEAIEEIVFFGRLEERKGLRPFCAALDGMKERLAERGIAVTFLGKPVQQDGGSTDDWIRRQAEGWRFPWRLETGFGQPEAVAYLRSRACVAVMPSPFDNSPCTIYEAIQYGIPFLASATGGIPELVHEDDRPRVLFDYTVEGIAAAIGRVLGTGAATVRPAIPPAESRRRWQALHEDWRRRLLPPLTARPVPILALIEHHGDDDATARTEASVRQVLQDRLAGLHRLPAGESAAVLLEAAPAAWLLLIRGGVTLSATAPAILDRALASPAIGDGFIPAGRLGQRVVPSIGSAPAFGCFAGYGESGGAVISVASARAASYAGGGLIDAVAAAGAQLWPVAAVMFELKSLPSITVTVDTLRRDVFATADPGMAEAIRSIATGGASRGRLRRALLRLADLPLYRHLVPIIRRVLPVLIEWRR